MMRAHRRHHGEYRAHELARQVAVGLDQPIDVVRLEAARPDVDEAVAQPVLDRIGMEIDRSDGQDQRVHLFGVESGVSRW